MVIIYARIAGKKQHIEVLKIKTSENILTTDIFKLYDDSGREFNYFSVKSVESFINKPELIVTLTPAYGTYIQQEIPTIDDVREIINRYGLRKLEMKESRKIRRLMVER